MPPKLKELIQDLKKAGFVDRGGKGSHRNFVHPKVSQNVTLSGKPSADALPYQIKAVKTALKELKK